MSELLPDYDAWKGATPPEYSEPREDDRPRCWCGSLVRPMYRDATRVRCWYGHEMPREGGPCE